MHPFRQTLLQGRAIALSGDVPSRVRELLHALGARVVEVGPDLGEDEERLAAWAQAAGSLDVLLCSEGSNPAVARDGSLARTWATVRAVATEAFIPKGEGRIVLLAPRHRGAVAAAALENLARTVSVEWARFGITTVAIAPGASTSEEEVAALLAFLCSPAGAYYSGCRIEPGSVDR
jgi:hypothetical protein